MISNGNLKEERQKASDNLNEQNNHNLFHVPRRIVYVNPIFEIQSGSKLPDTKSELVENLKTMKAIPFHKRICPKCHTIPKYEMWQNTDLFTRML